MARPLVEDEVLSVSSFAEGSATPTVYGGDGSSAFTVTKIAELPEGWEGF